MNRARAALWIKICGLTTPEAVSAALDAGVEAIGFVFADSPRRVTPEQARRLAAPARGKLRCVAVTRHPGQGLLGEILAGFQPDVLQTDAQDLEQLRLPRALELLPVLRTPTDRRALPERLLFEGAASGAGRVCDWSTAADVARRTRLILAGGLHPGNVAEAIAAVRPFGVDVSSGVELRPGVKDPAAIERFVAAARGAGTIVQE
jgi:phosphoribosylanthranilate isomerase